MQNNRQNVVRREPELYPRHEFTNRGPDGAAVCTRCHAIHVDKHWAMDESRAASMLAQPGAHLVVCPGCRAVEEKRADGLLTLRAPDAPTRLEEIEALLRAEERREMVKNPLQRIIHIERHGNEIEVATTTEFLARHLGRHLHMAFKGSLHIDKLPREAFTRVQWCGEEGSQKQ